MQVKKILRFLVLMVALITVAEAKYKSRDSRYDVSRHRRQIFWRHNRTPNRRVPNFRVPNFRVPNIGIPNVQIPDRPIRIPEVTVPEIRKIKIPDIQLPDIKVPDITIPDIPEIHVQDINVPHVEVPDFPVQDFDDTFRPVSEWFHQISNRRFRPSFSRQNERDWKLTWGWFDNREARSEVRPRPGPVHGQGVLWDAGIGAGRGEFGDRFGSRMDWPFRDMFGQPHIDGGAGGMNPRWRPPSRPSNRPVFPRPDPSSTFFHNFPHRHHHPQRPLPRPPHRPSGARPPFDTLCRGRHYSARRYEPSMWVGAAVVNGSSLDTLRRIKEYFNGENGEGRVMLMSRPLRMTVTGINGTISDTEDTVEEFRLSAMVPMDRTRRVPTPTDPMLSITSEPRQVYFATHFRHDRRPGTPAIYDEFFEMQDALDLAGESFEQAVYHSAFYETWTDIASGSTTLQPGEILIPSTTSEENLVCARQESRRPQNGIEQCGNSRCPDYEHLEQLRDDIELRRIKGGTYITRRAPACTLVLPAFVSHCALKRYLAGANSEGQRYPSPAPFVHYVFPSRSATSLCKQTAISAYMLPANMTAAEPTECSGWNRRDMRIRSVPDREAFVMKFGGRPNQRTIEHKVDELREFLREQRRCFVRDRYAVAVYDHPFNRPPHLNEILLFKTTGPCRDSNFDGTARNDVDIAGSTVPTSSTSRMTTESPATDGMLFEEEVEPSTETAAVDETTTLQTTTRSPAQMSTNEATTEKSPLIEVNLTLESNSVELDRDLIPYRFSGNQTDFPEDFPVDVFVF